MKLRKFLAAATALTLLLGAAATPEVGSEIKLALTAHAESGEIPIDAAHFPDEFFRTYVLKKCDTDGNTFLSDDEIENVLYIDCSDDAMNEIAPVLNNDIISLKGIEYFTALTELNCHGNKIEKIDVSKNTELIDLYVSGNDLSALDVSKNTALRLLECDNNELKTIDVSQNKELTELYCGGNLLTSLDVSKNIKLEILQCVGGYITDLDVTNNVNLVSLWCDMQQLSSLDVSKNTKLTWLSCSYNSIKKLDISNNTLLKYLSCDGNNISLLDISNNIGLLKAYVAGEQYTVGSKTYVYDGDENDDYNDDYYLLSVDSDTEIISNVDTDLKVDINKENFPDDNFRAYVSENFDTDADGKLSAKELYTVDTIYLWRKDITSLKGVEYFPVLKKLACVHNFLTELDLSKNSVLTWLECNNNQLKSIDVSGCAALEYFDCSDNLLTELNLSNNANLGRLQCGYNALEKLDVTKNSLLCTLDCAGNRLSEIDVSKNAELVSFVCFGNNIKKLNISNNKNVLKLMEYESNRGFETADGIGRLLDDANYFSIIASSLKHLETLEDFEKIISYTIIEHTTVVAFDKTTQIQTAPEVEAGTADVSGMQNNLNVDITDMGITFEDESGETYTAQVQADGTIMLPSLPAGEYTVTASLENCPSRDYTVTVESGKPIELDVELKLYGDVNGDGILTVFDVMPVNKCAQKIGTLEGYDFKVADVTNDNKLDVFDCMKINAHIKKTALMW